MGSIPIRTAKLPGIAMVSISEFDSEDVGSHPIPTADVVFSLFGKVPHGECGEQGSIPGDNQVRE
jgi:hypothetical protein